jgi:hypothetical protein
VADAEAGMVAFASTSELRVTGTADLPAQLPVGELHLALTDDHLVLAGDDEAAWFDRTTLAAVGEPESLATRLAGLTTDGGSVLAWTDGALEAQRLLPPTGTGKPAT